MNRTKVLGLAASMALAVPALADTSAERFNLATTRLAEGERLLAHAKSEKSKASQLQDLDRSIALLREVRKAGWSNNGAAFDKLWAVSSDDLQRALDSEAEIYIARGSLTMAEKRVNEALDLEPNDARTNNLSRSIDAAKNHDAYGTDLGLAAVERIRGRRLAANFPIRDRGIAGRR